MDQRTLDQVVKAVTKELATQGVTVNSPSRAGAQPESQPGAFWLVDSWRIRGDSRDAFLDLYTRAVADVIGGMSGFRSARILSAATGSPYSWHVQAFYEFASDGILDVFDKEFDRLVRQVNARWTREKVLDEMAQWVLAHEDGALAEVWRR